MRTVAGQVAILGRPNVGKSTLLNALVGEKLAFVDTPGVHGSKKALNRFMVQEALGTIESVDAALLVVDAGDRRPGNEERQILRELSAAKRPTVLAVNKVD